MWKGKTLDIWYRYPSEEHPRTVRVKVTCQSTSIADAVSVAVGKDMNMDDVVSSSTPTIRLLERLKEQPNPEVAHALYYASIQPPPFGVNVDTPKKKRHSSGRPFLPKKRRKV